MIVTFKGIIVMFQRHNKQPIRLLVILLMVVFVCCVLEFCLKYVAGASRKDTKMDYRLLGASDKLKDGTRLSRMETVLEEAHKVSSVNKTILVTLMNDAFMPFAFSWLCNTQSMNIHESVLVVTTSDTALIKLKTSWPNLHVVSMNVDISPDKQDYSTAEYVRIMIRRSELFQALIEADYEVMLFEFDYVWFGNPVPTIQKMNDVDMLVNPVSNTNNEVVNGGCIYLFPTKRTKSLWKELTHRLDELGKQIQSKTAGASVSEKTNDQTFLSSLVSSRYANVTTRPLPLDRYADGKWYVASDKQRQRWKPIMISNNWVIGIDNKIKRAKEFGHWFLKEDGTCDTEQVQKVTNKAT